MENPFRELEPEDNCPVHVKAELVSEIDLIRNALQVMVLYTGGLFDVVTAMTESTNPKKPIEP